MLVGRATVRGFPRVMGHSGAVTNVSNSLHCVSTQSIVSVAVLAPLFVFRPSLFDSGLIRVSRVVATTRNHDINP